MATYLQVTAVPDGEAPLWVRERWVGLLLPLAPRRRLPVSRLTAGVLSGPRGFTSRLVALTTGKLRRQTGYVVAAKAAVDVLAVSSPEAAAWWRKNTPQLMRRNAHLVFHPTAGRVIDA